MRWMVLIVVAMFAVACTGEDSWDRTQAVERVEEPTTAPTATPASAERVRVRTVRVDSLVVGPDGDEGTQINVLFVGGRRGSLEDSPCVGEYEVEVVESASEIVVIVHALALADTDLESVVCTLEGYARQERVELTRPIDSRAVIDGHDGTQRAVVDPAALLWPALLPEDWIVRSRGASGSQVISTYGRSTTADDGIMLVAGPVDENTENLAMAMSDSGSTVERITVRGGPPENAAILRSNEAQSVTVAFEEAGMYYRVTSWGDVSEAVLMTFVLDLEIDTANRRLEIPFEAESSSVDGPPPVVTPTPTAGVPAPTPVPADREVAWSAADTQRDVENYLEALRQGAFEQAAWPITNNGVALNDQRRDESAADYLARVCRDDRCDGPYTVQAEPGYVDPVTFQAQAVAFVRHEGTGQVGVIRLSTVEGQKLIASLPPLGVGQKQADLHDLLFENRPPQDVVIERFDAFEIWRGASRSWHTNWHADETYQIEGDVLLARSGAFGVRDPQHSIESRCARLLERDGRVLMIDQCETEEWAVVDTETGQSIELPVEREPAGEAASAWYDERGGAVLVGVRDAEGNLVALRTEAGVDVLGNDYAGIAVISVDGRRIAYVDHRDPAALSHFWSPVVVVRDLDTGAEVGRWTLAGPITCLEFSVDWVVACEADAQTVGSGDPDQVSLAAIDLLDRSVNRVLTTTRLFLPGAILDS